MMLAAIRAVTLEQFEAFLCVFETDPGLQKMLQESRGSAEDVVSIARSAGFDVNVQDLDDPVELSLGELSGITGGINSSVTPTGYKKVLSKYMPKKSSLFGQDLNGDGSIG